MYDFSFTITYDPGADAYMDTFIESDSLRSEAVYACLDPTQLWSLEFLTGDPGELEAVDAHFEDGPPDRESVSGRPCAATRTVSRLAGERRRRVTYAHLSDIDYCDAVPLLATQFFETGVVFKQVRSGATAQWRVLAQDDEKVGLLYDSVSARLADGLSFSFDHLTEIDRWRGDLLAPGGLRAEQRQTLVTAVEHGYFETPREVTLDELADALDVPRSTVSYRLRRATAELAKAFVDEGVP